MWNWSVKKFPNFFEGFSSVKIISFQVNSYLPLFYDAQYLVGKLKLLLSDSIVIVLWQWWQDHLFDSFQITQDWPVEIYQASFFTIDVMINCRNCTVIDSYSHFIICNKKSKIWLFFQVINELLYTRKSLITA